jgi:transcriptional regulator GlxA family with amidase domain
MSLTSRRRRFPWRRKILVTAYLLAFLLVPAVVGYVNFNAKIAAGIPPETHLAYNGPIPAPTYDPNKRIAVIVSGSNGMEITDTLPTYEILARSGAFNVYVVAPERTVLRFINSGPSRDSGLDFVPHFSYAGYDATIGKEPDLIAIPALDGSRDAVIDWVRSHAGPRTTLLGICVGSAVLADTGLLDGHTATQNTQWFDRVAAQHPTVRLVRDVRYVDDGPVITSTNVAAGIDATLHTVARLVGRSVAEDVARQLGYTYTGFLDDASFAYPSTFNWLVPASENAAFELPQEKLGVLVSDGMSEFGLAALLDTYTGSLAARADVFAPERTPVVSRNGLVLIPRYDFSNVPALDRIVAPAGEPTPRRQQAIAAWEQLRPDRPVQEIHQGVGPAMSAFELTSRDLGRHHNGMVAAAIAEANFAPIGQLSDAAWPVQPIGMHLLLGILGVALVCLSSRIPLRYRVPARSLALSNGSPVRG